MPHSEDTALREGVDLETIRTVESVGSHYRHGWETDIETEYAPKGLDEDIVRLISAKNEEPEWLTDWRCAAYLRWTGLEEPSWAMVDYPSIDYQNQYYYAKPKSFDNKAAVTR